jgi:hypothetical protein
MVFTRKYKPESVEPLKLSGREIAFTNSLKYLGVFLDPKINWKQHLTERRNKFYSCLWACRRTMGKNWVINRKVAIWMYKTVSLPQILYASAVWSVGWK